MPVSDGRIFVMATEIYRHLTYFFRLSALIIAICWCEAVDSTLPCPVTNSTTGAMLCCSSYETNTTHPPDEDEECVEILPLTSASLLKEFWTIKEFNVARRDRKNNTSPHHLNDSRDGTCCCKEKVDLILPGMATTVSGSVSHVLQSSPGFVQPVSARMCKEASCSRRPNGKKNISSCIQRWTATDLYIEDPIHDGFMRKESIKVPSGCDCRAPETDPSSDNKTVRAFSEKKKYLDKDFLVLEDSIVTNIPTLPDTEYHRHLVGRDRSILNRTNPSLSSNQPQYSNSSYVSLPVGDYRNASQPHTSYTDAREQPFIDDKQKAVMPGRDQSSQIYHPPGFSHHSSDTVYEGPAMGAPKMEVNTNHRTLHDNHPVNPYNFESAPARQGPTQTMGSDPQANFGTLVPQDRLRALNNLVSAPPLQPVNPQLVSNLNDLNSLMANYIKMGLLSTNARAMTTTQIVENALTKVHSSQQMQALAMAERLMLLEIEYLRLSLSMAEMSLRQVDGTQSSSVPKFSFVNDPSRENIPVIFKPGGLNGPLPVVIVDSNKTSTFIGSSSNIPSSQGSGAAKPLTFGNPPVRGELAPLTQFKNDSVLIKIETPSLKTETPPKRETPSTKLESSSSRLETPPLRKETPSSVETTKLRAEPISGNTSRASMMDDMLEEELYAAFANYLFQEAWMNSSCTVPLTISESQSELNFLPEIIKEKLDIRVGGRVDIHKFAARIIAGIIKCRFQNQEIALLDGSLARAITGGIKVAEILNSHIKIIKGLMRGLLDTDAAKGLVSILKWASRLTGSPATEEFVSSRDAMDIENILILVKDSLKVYIDIFGSSIKAALNVNQQGVSSASSLPHFTPSTTETSSSNKNPIGSLRNIGIKPQDNSATGLNATVVVMPELNGTRPGMNSTAAPLPGIKTTSSGFILGSSVTAVSVATPVTASSTVDATKTVTNATAMAVSGINTTAAPVAVPNVTSLGSTAPAVLSSATPQTKRNDTLPGGSGMVSPATPNPVTSRYDKYSTSKVGVLPDAHDHEDHHGGNSFHHVNKSQSQGKPTSYGAHSESGAEISFETKNTSRQDPDKWVPGYGDDDFVDNADKKTDKKGQGSSSGDNFGYGPGPEDYEGSGEYSPIDDSVLLPKEKPKNPDVIGNLPKEYDPLDIAPGSLMNLLFPNLR